jgi:hypothetical protein
VIAFVYIKECSSYQSKFSLMISCELLGPPISTSFDKYPEKPIAAVFEADERTEGLASIQRIRKWSLGGEM